MIILQIKLTDGREVSGEYDTFQLCQRLAELQRLQEMQEASNIASWEIL